MPVLFARLIIIGLKAFSEVPADLKDAVHISLTKQGYGDNGKKLVTN